MTNSALSTPSLSPSGNSTPESKRITPLNFPNSLEAPEIGVQCQVRTRIPTSFGNFYLHVYHSRMDDKEHLALVFGEDIFSSTLNQEWPGDNPTQRIVRGARPHTISSTEAKNGSSLLRIHSECFTGETVGSVRCDCGDQLDTAMRAMAKEGRGVILYLRQEGRGIGLLNKMRAYNLQDLGYDTVDANLLLGLPADGRDYRVAVSILEDLGVDSVKLLTNNPLKMAHMQNAGIKVTERVAMVPKEWKEDSSCDQSPLGHSEVDGYIRTKILRMGHLLQAPLSLDPPNSS